MQTNKIKTNSNKTNTTKHNYPTQSNKPPNIQNQQNANTITNDQHRQNIKTQTNLPPRHSKIQQRKVKLPNKNSQPVTQHQPPKSKLIRNPA